GESDGAQKIYEQISFAASNDMPVLITGEPGTGKSTIAKLIHRLSRRRNLGRFCVLHPGLSNDEQVYVELFGARKGAYTGLTENRTGLVEFANKGTLFLDDVTDFTPNIQVLLLRVLEEKKFRRLGETDDRISDFRLISATNQNPEKLVNEGKLRFDFFSRIARLTIYVPPLRKRKNDIVPLAEHILRKISSDNNSSELQLSPECYEYLVNETWRGNIRELLAALERAYHFAIYEGSGVILPKHFQFCALGDASIEKPLGLNEAVDEFRKSLILKKLIEADWNISETARQLRIDRNQLRRYVSRYGLQSRKSEIS
ncbi:MAG: sigma 54-interacting transcriptional regulator, partial [Deltaproteobacteria bacterium]|nr:sigma 54-interacting transcriptional regulator [Deltaproteobacteria bacterium]